ncbi:MAG: hypothetical protein HQK49_08040 [Oligoflexia bacterium]|nr:hypothetical protein [Oligoflexia bacterium]
MKNQLVYNYDDYKVFILEECKHQKITLQHLSEKAKIQKTYLSKVLKHHVHLNEDQLFSIATLLCLEGNEVEYLLMLLRYQRTQKESLKKFLYQNVLEYKKKYLNLNKRLAAKNIEKKNNSLFLQHYFLNKMIPIVHMYLCINEYADNLKKLSSKLDLTASELSFYLKVLMELGYIQEDEQSKNKIKLVDKFIHISSDHPLSKQNHINWRLKAIGQIEKANVPNLIKKNNSNNKGSLKGNKTANIDNYYFSATVCSDQESFDKLKEDIKKLIVSYNEKLKRVDANMVFQFNIDLFEI